MKKFFDKLVHDHKGSTGGGTSAPLLGKLVQIGSHNVRVESVLGEGGLATVYKAVDSAGNTFALKHLRLANADAVQDMTDEARTLAKLKGHPHVLKLFATAFVGPEGSETDGFMLLEFCPSTLLGLMQSSNFQLDEVTIFTVFSEVCKAVAHMHAQTPPLAHRDLKAENVLRSASGQWVLADFGSCTSRAQVYNTAVEIAEEEEQIRRNTTPAYRAPEMWDLYSRQLIDTKVDVWSLGVLLYVLLFGKLPFQDARLAILNGRYDMPSAAGRSPAMRQLVRALLVTSPADRPDMRGVLSMLEGVKLALTSQLLGEPQPPFPAGGQQPAPLQRQSLDAGPGTEASRRPQAAAAAPPPQPSTAAAQAAAPAAAAAVAQQLIDVDGALLSIRHPPPDPFRPPAPAATFPPQAFPAPNPDPFTRSSPAATFEPDWGDQPAWGDQLAFPSDDSAFPAASAPAASAPAASAPAAAAAPGPHLARLSPPPDSGAAAPAPVARAAPPGAAASPAAPPLGAAAAAPAARPSPPAAAATPLAPPPEAAPPAPAARSAPPAAAATPQAPPSGPAAMAHPTAAAPLVTAAAAAAAAPPTSLHRASAGGAAPPPQLLRPSGSTGGATAEQQRQASPPRESGPGPEPANVPGPGPAKGSEAGPASGPANVPGPAAEEAGPAGAPAASRAASRATSWTSEQEVSSSTGGSSRLSSLPGSGVLTGGAGASSSRTLDAGSDVDPAQALTGPYLLSDSSQQFAPATHPAPAAGTGAGASAASLTEAEQLRAQLAALQTEHHALAQRVALLEARAQQQQQLVRQLCKLSGVAHMLPDGP